MARWLALGLAAVAATSSVAGCGTGSNESVRLARFADAQIAFSYPAPWRAQYADSGLSLEESIVVALSTLPLRSPGRRLSANTWESGTDLMLKRLPPGGIFVVWTVGGLDLSPNYPAEKRGNWTTIGGRPAKLSFDPPAWACGWLKPTEAITAYIAGHVEMTACARDNPAFESRVKAMLSSVAFPVRSPTAFRLTATNENVGTALFRLRCQPAGGDVGRAAAACAALDRNPNLLLEPTRFQCQGGPSSWWNITIKGRFRGRPLHVTTSTCWTPQMPLIKALGIANTLENHLVCSAGTPLSPKGLRRC